MKSAAAVRHIRLTGYSTVIGFVFSFQLKLFTNVATIAILYVSSDSKYCSL